MSEPESRSAIRSQSGGSTSRTLLNGLRANEAEAWDRLVTLYAPLVYHWCRQQGLPNSDMSDLLQDVFQSVAAHIGRFRKERAGDTFRGWLRTITRNKVADHFRKRAVQPQAAGGTTAFQQMGAVPAPSGSLSASASQSELAADAVAQRDLLARALNLIREEFEDRTWQAFWQTAVESRSAADVAAELGMSAGAVRVAKCRVLRRLREELGETV
jgi:RNA polymerase sigma-70 factor (ECF subfamily)